MAATHTSSDPFDFNPEVIASREIGGSVVEGLLVHTREDGLNLTLGVLGGASGGFNCWVAVGGADGHADIHVFIGMDKPGLVTPEADFIL